MLSVQHDEAAVDTEGWLPTADIATVKLLYSYCTHVDVNGCSEC